MQMSDGGGGGSAITRRLSRSSNNNPRPRKSSPYVARVSNRTKSRGSSIQGPPATNRVSIRSNSSGRYSPPAPVPSMPAGGAPVPSINSYLGGDTGYQQQLRQLAKALSDFRADVTRRRGILDQDYGTSRKALEDQKILDLENIEDDYASRGLQRSGLYAEAVGDYEKEFGTRMTELQRRQQQAIQQLLQQQSQFQTQNKLSQQSAREAALRRRAERYGI